ncbi:hypothetical protein N7520_004504 [Penicillium odoratum]|uniref:uncharacterized protein n=1 Tax=Penicillium odoratum TaxID=1167516 RepID=UPI002547D250|nr:uncharacterized protein N7520_004504 [Penicillium odoratum]KAJ5764945.1 hypothetical protein N7520_004504 [Penicillium odoratum]
MSHEDCIFLRFIRFLCHIPDQQEGSLYSSFHQWRRKPHRNAGSGAAVMDLRSTFSTVNVWDLDLNFGLILDSCSGVVVDSSADPVLCLELTRTLFGLSYFGLPLLAKD